MRKLFTVLASFFCFYLFAQEGSYELTVEVENIESFEGKVRVGLFDNEKAFLKNAILGDAMEIKDSKVVFKLKGIASGTYAISIYHDENNNGELDANFIGMPTEPFGFSNNAMGMFGPPSFDDCKFEINGANKVITIKL